MPTKCPNCGRGMEQAAAFCPYCGAKTGNARNEPAAVAAELGGLGATEAYVSPDVLGEFTEKFLAAAEAVAQDYGGIITREGATAVTITFPPGIDSPAVKAASCAVALRNTTRDLISTALKELGPIIYLKAGVDATEGPAELPGASSPRNAAKRLRNKAGKWAILAGENVYAMTENYFSYATVGFYQARSGKPAVKIYQLTEDRRHPSTAPPARKRHLAPVRGFEKKIEASLSAVLSGPKKQTVAVTGASGSGKTAALETAARVAREKGFQVYANACLARRRYQPFSLWAPLWREMFSSLAPDAAPADAPAAALKRLDARFGIWAPLFDALLGIKTAAKQYVAEAPAELRRRRLEEIGLELIYRTAALRPTAVVLDDLHLADPSSQAFLGSLLARETETRLAVFFSCASSEHSLCRLSDLTFSTEPLTEEDVRLFADSFGAAYENEIPEALFAASRGNPGVLEQLLLLSQEKPDIKIDALAADGALDPAAIVARRLRDFEKPWLGATAALATIGIPLSDDDVSALAADALGTAGVAVESWRYKIYKFGLLQPTLAANDERRIVPPHLTAAFLAAAAPKPESKREAAKIAARFAASRYPDELSARATLELDAGNLAAAYDNAYENVTRARWLGSPHDAVDQLTAVIRQLENVQPRDKEIRDRLSRLLLARAQAFREAGLVAAALSDLEKIAATDDGLDAQRLYAQGRVYLARNYYRESEKALIGALQKAVRAGNDSLVADAEIALAELFLQKGDFAKAIYELEKSIKGKRATDARAYLLLGDLKYRSGDVAAAAKAADDGLALAEKKGTPLAAAEIGLAFAPVIFEWGRVGRARKLLKNSRQVFELIGDTTGECDALLAESGLDFFTEDLAASEHSFSSALRAAEKYRLNSCAAHAALGLSIVKLFQDDGDAYERLLAKGREFFEEEPGPPAPALRVVEATKAYFADRDYDAAYGLAYDAADECNRKGRSLLYGAASLLAAWAALARGELQSSREIIGRPELERRARESKVFATGYNKAAGGLFLAEGDADRASTYLRAAAAAGRELGLWLLTAEAYLDLAALPGAPATQDNYRRRAVWLLESKGARLLAERAGALFAPRASRTSASEK